MATHAAAWLVTRPQRLSRRAAGAIARERPRDGLAIASVTLLELAQLLVENLIRPRGTPQDWLREFVGETGIHTREISVDIAAVAAHLPEDFPADPFDRLIAATAIVEKVPLVTSDARIQRSRVVPTIW